MEIERYTSSYNNTSCNKKLGIYRGYNGYDAATSFVCYIVFTLNFVESLCHPGGGIFKLKASLGVQHRVIGERERANLVVATGRFFYQVRQYQ